MKIWATRELSKQITVTTIISTKPRLLSYIQLFYLCGFIVTLFSLAEFLTNWVNYWWVGQVWRWSNLWSSSWRNDSSTTLYYWRYVIIMCGYASSILIHARMIRYTCMSMYCLYPLILPWYHIIHLGGKLLIYWSLRVIDAEWAHYKIKLYCL